ncbi:MAG TPA: Na+/H+ antiporter NhaA [Planctomycetota bacterium]|nr:Na+/H+ antiporter NhaA [Planctomycetota bacterium]
MALFVANLAFASDQLVAAAKLGVLLGSALAGIGGTLLLSFASRHATPERT